MPTTGGLGKAVTSGKAIGCTAVQVFTSSPQQWKAKVVDDSMVEAFCAAKTETGIDCVVSHDSYLINLCAPTEEAREKSIIGLSGEIERCARYGIDRVVSHLGGHLGQGEDEGIRLIVESLLRILGDAPESVTVLMETTAGQGSSINHKFENIARILEGCKGHPRLGVCMDTCHIFAAGYDIRTPETYEQTMALFEKVVGFDRLMAVHCNDSKKDFGSKVDRHEHIGEGFIGIEAFRCLVNDARFTDIPVLLETPEAAEMHETNLNKLKSLMG
jgi:deoxyribonuclease-4